MSFLVIGAAAVLFIIGVIVAANGQMLLGVITCLIAIFGAEKLEDLLTGHNSH